MRFSLLIAVFLAGAATTAVAFAEAKPEPTRIEVDSKNGSFLFYVKGNIAAVLNEDGLHVRQTIHYGDGIMNYGETGFNRATKETGRPAERKQ